MSKNFILDKKLQGKAKMPEEKCRRQDQITIETDSCGEYGRSVNTNSTSM